MNVKTIWLFLGAAVGLFGFDTRTHVWIAQQIINDLQDDGKVTIEPFGSFDVDPAVAKAIVDFPDVYRMGNVGPDGFPDVVGGQVTAHPGLEDTTDEDGKFVHGWKSDEWFEWVLKQAKAPEEVAFAYGYLAHGAGDVFAHTYVNMYCGDIFDMNDGETDVEKRHILLEKFISDRLPPIENTEGKELGAAYDLVATAGSLPLHYLVSTLLLDAQPAAQYALSGTAKYLQMLYEFRRKVANLDDDDIGDLLDADAKRAAAICDATRPWRRFFGRWFGGFSTHCAAEELVKRKRRWLEEMGFATFNYRRVWLAQIDHALEEYIRTSALMSRDFMQAGTDPYARIKHWIDCYGAAFTDPTTLAARGVEAGCRVRDDAAEKLAFLGDVKAGDRGIFRLKRDVEALAQGLGSEAISLMGVAVLEVVAVRNKEASAASLDEQFGQDGSDKHLLVIPDMSRRVLAEMGAERSGTLDPHSFAVLYDAVVLSKLTLLSSDSLRVLARRAGVRDERVVTSLDRNVLFNAVRSIDGNHQWLSVAPPYPRRDGVEDTQIHRYGYDANATHGWRLYQNEVLREAVFGHIFKGPVSPGLEMPELIGFDIVLPANYPYVSCEKHPFPNGIEDRRCRQ